MLQVSAEEAKSRLPDLISAAINGETVFITQNGKEVVQLTPVLINKGKRQFGSAKGLIHMSDDFDSPLEDFNEYVE